MDVHDIISKAKLKTEPDWFYGKIGHLCSSGDIKHGKNDPIQEDDGFKPFLVDISNFGLNYAYQKYNQKSPDADNYKYTKTKFPKDIIIIGAGMSGLVSGYELAQVGHNVQILEMQHRVGGRIKTLGDEKFRQGLWADAGAMRLPGNGTPYWTGPSHFMTDYYAQKFDLPLKQFVNSSDEGFYYFYGQEPIKIKEWNKKPDYYCKKFWPEWRTTIDEAEKEDPDCLKGENITDIGAYYGATVKPVVDQLHKLLDEDPCNAWQPWVRKWSMFSVRDFLRSSFREIIIKLKKNDEYDEKDNKDLKNLKYLLPWSLDAVVGFTTLSYTLNLDVSLVDWLRDELGQWWMDPMHTFEDGMRMLPQAFAKENTKGWNTDVDLSNNITFGVMAREIHYKRGSVKVVCHNRTTKKDQTIEGHMVIITLPLNIVRQTSFFPPLPTTMYKAIENISYSPSTKIMLQCKTQFWQEEKLEGGFSKTNMPIGQLHYPSNPGLETPQNERGILMCYTWKQEALLFGSQSPEDAISEAVEEISHIHPKIYDNFEVGAVQAWYNDPSAQGAFCFPRPEEYLAQEILYYPHENLYFCGEALSTTNGWIQGALVSGLRSAYQLHTRNENDNKV